jgi:lipopolysaccharide biosynthesis protein
MDGMSPYSEHGHYWREDLLKALVGDSLKVRKTITALRQGAAGLVGPGHYYLTNSRYWGCNQDRLMKLLAYLYPKEVDKEPQLGFFAGSMFWYSPVVMQTLARLPEDMLRFEDELNQQDGTLAHAIERLFCILARELDLSVSSTALPSKPLTEADCLHKSVPVL